MKKFLLVALPLMLVAAATIGACSRRAAGGGQSQLLDIAQSRGLSPEDAARAVKTFVPPGGRDEYMLFASGGHSGQVHVIGVPSMRLLKTIAVFTPEPWQGYGYGADWSEMSLGDTGATNGHGPHAGTNGNGNGIVDPTGRGPKEPLRWGDSHHPALSETAGKYDGRWLYINDRAHGRIGMVDLSDFRAKQILQVPNLQTSHGGMFATPNTEYVHISSKVPALKAWNASQGKTATLDDHLNRYADIYRGYSTFVSVNPAERPHGSLEELPDRAAARTRRISPTPARASATATPSSTRTTSRWRPAASQQGKPPIEVGASQLDFDYLHIINWKKAEQVVAAGKFTEINGIRVISLETAVAEGILHLAPEPRSPHGVDIAPKGDYITVSGKLDPHATVYGFDLIKKAIDDEELRRQGPLRRPDPQVRRGGRRQGGARRGPAAHAVRQPGQRLHQPLPRERGREVDARRAVPPRRQGVQARRQGLDPLQHRPPRHDAGRHDGPAGQVPDRHEQVVDRPPHQRRPAASAELPVDRHLGREDGAAGRHADRLRRAALRADGQGRHASRPTTSTAPASRRRPT